MRRTMIALIAVAVVLCPAAADAQWQIESTEDDFTGAVSWVASTFGGNDTFLVILCEPGDWTVALSTSDGIFHDGDVDLRLDDGEIERFTFADGDETVMLAGPEAKRLAERLPNHSELRARYTKWRNDLMTDRWSLDGVGDVLPQLQRNCK